MSPYMIYQMVQAEQATQRARSSTAQRQADAQLGELAAAVAQCLRSPGFPRLGFRGLGFRGLRPRGRRSRPAREMP